MDINSIQGANQYQNPPSAAPLDTNALRSQNTEASTKAVDEKNAESARQAFNVNISAEGRQQLAAAQEPPAEPPMPENSESGAPGGNMTQGSEASRLVNIVA